MQFKALQNLHLFDITIGRQITRDLNISEQSCRQDKHLYHINNVYEMSGVEGVMFLEWEF